MSKVFLVLSLLLISNLSFAQIISKPSLEAISGRIESNNPDLDLSKIRIKQALYCLEGWGDGQRQCGVKEAEANVNSKGEFKLSGIKGESRKWFSASYDVYYGEQLLFSNPYKLDLRENKESLKKLLSHFTIFFIKPFKVNFKTDTGVDFLEWLKEDNQNNDVGIRIRFNSFDDSKVSSILPQHQLNLAMKENNSLVSILPQMIPGSLENTLAKGLLNYEVESRYYGNYSSKVLSQKQLRFNDEFLLEKLSNVTLNTKIIDYTVNGLWKIRLDVSFHEGNNYFQLEDPTVFINSQCVNETLIGKVTLEFNKNESLNEVRELSGTCSKGKAEFDISLVATNYSTKNDLRKFNFKISLFDIAADSGKATTTDIDTLKVYKSYGGVERCSKLVRNNKYLVCER